MTKTPQPDDLDLLSAIWILASNDENPLITFRGINHRLGLPIDFDIKTIIRSRPELFRPGCTESRINTLKSELSVGRSLPGWLTAIPNKVERSAAIEKLNTDDVFRSQFRAHANAERSPIEIIKWGLEHLDRLRRAKAEAKDATAKRWQMWLVFWVSIAGVLSQFGIAFAKYRGWI